MKVHVVGGDKHYATWIPGVELSSFQNADLVLFTGGEDVSPKYYGEAVGRHTYVNEARDASEYGVFRNSQALGKKMLGICRGAQFINVCCGGKMVQHVTNHAIYGTHSVKFKDGAEVNLTSTHHQMMFPYTIQERHFDLIAWSTVRRSETYLNGVNEERMSAMFGGLIKDSRIFQEPEIVHFKVNRALGIQAHPEMMHADTEGQKKCIELINQFMDDKL